MESYGIEINDLPNEIIIKIHRFLKNSDLKEAILTCKFWKSIIESSCPFSLKVNWAVKNIPQQNFLATTERKFRSIEFRGVLSAPDSSAIIDFYRRHGLNIVELRLVDVRLDKLATLVQMLNCLPNLNRLIIFGTIASDSHLSGVVNFPVLPKLETLHITGIEYRILRCLKNVKVTTLSVMNSTYRQSYNCDALKDFLKNQDRLTTLALRYVFESHSMLFRTSCLNDPMPFQLTRLSLIHIQLAEEDYRNLLKFIEAHSQSLKELELGDRFDHSIYECVFNKMTKLETLNLMVDTIPRRRMVGRWKENRSIKKLIIKNVPFDTAGSVPFFRDIIKCLPNVTSLSMGLNCTKAILEVVAENLTQLRELQFSQYNAEFSAVHFPNLQALHIELLNDKVDWQIFSKAHPKLTEFSIRMARNVDEFMDIFGEHSNDNNLEEIAKMAIETVHLQTLRIGEWIKVDARFLEVLRMNCPHLKTLELHKKCVILNEQYDQGWVGVLRFCERHFDFIRHLQAPFEWVSIR